MKTEMAVNWLHCWDVLYGTWTTAEELWPMVHLYPERTGGQARVNIRGWQAAEPSYGVCISSCALIDEMNSGVSEIDSDFGWSASPHFLVASVPLALPSNPLVLATCFISETERWSYRCHVSNYLMNHRTHLKKACRDDQEDWLSDVSGAGLWRLQRRWHCPSLTPHILCKLPSHTRGVHSVVGCFHSYAPLMD